MEARHPLGLITAKDVKNLILALGVQTKTPWAVLLFMFQDDQVEHRPRSYYERLFTEAGSGSMNMVDYFREMSHEKLDLSGSQVFGWFRLPVDRADYVASGVPADKYDRDEMAELCFRVAREEIAREKGEKEEEVLSDFAHFVIVFNTPADLYGRTGLAVCDSGNAFPTPVGHEMGHGYGMDHSRREGSTDDYQDPWDVMSAMNTQGASHREYGEIGPGLNAALMRAQGWLKEGRVWREDGLFKEVVELRPLHRLDLNGYLAAEVGDYLVEFRVRDRWDAGIHNPCVLVHRFDQGHSYVMRGERGDYELLEDDIFLEAASGIAPQIGVEILAINESDMVATVRLTHEPVLVTPELIAQIVVGVAEGGGGLILLGGKLVRIPPHQPLIALIRPLIAILASVSETGEGEVEDHSGAKRAALTALTREALAQLHELGPAGIPDEGPNLKHFGLQ